MDRWNSRKLARVMATSVLKEYLTKGFVRDDERLIDGKIDIFHIR